MALIDVNHHHYFHQALPGDVAAQLEALRLSITNLQRTIEMANEQIKADLQEVLAKQAKTAEEIAALKQSSETLQQTVAQLEEAVANANQPDPELVALVGQVKANAESLDALIPDLAPPAAG
jgi:predicted  nucleic acid-binding Zn-ribbon protein